MHHEPRPGRHAPAPFGAFQGPVGRATLFGTGQTVYRHAHAQFNVLINVSGADETYVVDGVGPCPLTRDRLILLNPWTPHASRRSAWVGRATVLSLFFEAGTARSPQGRSIPRNLFPQPSATMTAEVRVAAENLAHMLTTPDPVPGVDLEAALDDAFATVIATYGVDSNSPVAMPSLDGRIRRAVEMMRREPVPGLDIDAVCREVGLSRTRFYDRFRVSLGISPRLFIDGLRFDAAIGMLARSERSLADIAYDLGFPAQSQFSRFFKEKTGFCPSAYRRSVSGCQF